jgi:rare lipoprotein A (peptidoglycan hydrolase)
MLFNDKILTLFACGAVGAATITPMTSQAISVSTYNPDSFTYQTKWDREFEQKTPTYKTPLASVYYGQASWYGPGFYGNTTANGEVYRPGTMTAAHRSLPFGTRVRVTNLNNGRSRIVRINDRGPYVGGRILDLSESAAQSLGVINSGVASVKVEVLN